MRPTKTDIVDGSSLMEKQSGSLAAVKDLWDVWEIHCLILLSLFLQVFLFLAAGMRMRSASSVLRTVLWLAYLSADSVAIFVLGHLAVHASGPRHQLMFFWAPFVLVHLGGQDTITAFSKQDNELWRRHLLSLVSHTAFAGYVVAKASWPDSRLRAAMALMFLCGCLKYAERTYCLYSASPGILISRSLRSLSHTLRMLRVQERGGATAEARRYHWTTGFHGWGWEWEKGPTRDGARSQMSETFDMMLRGRRSWQSIRGRGITGSDITSVDALHNTVPATILAEAGDLPDMLGEFLSDAGRCKAYEYVGVRLVHCYQRLYTKNPLREATYIVARDLVHRLRIADALIRDSPLRFFAETCLDTLFLLYSLFHYVSTPIALVLFMAAEKGIHTTSSRADVTVSYILLLGAIVLDMCSAALSMFSNVSFNHLPVPAGNLLRRVADHIPLPAWSKKHWSQELAQYSMIRRHATPAQGATTASAGMAASIRQWIGKRLDPWIPWGVGFFDLTHAPINDVTLDGDSTSIMEFVLDKLLCFGKSKEWNISSSRGQVSLRKWIREQGGHRVPVPVPVPEEEDSALFKSTNSSVDFPTTVLIWHIATDICYFFQDDDNNARTINRIAKRHKKMSRELSNYIMYLVFKCGVMLTSQSQFVYEEVHREIRHELLTHETKQPHQQVINNLGENEAVRKLFKAWKEDDHRKRRRQQDETPPLKKHGAAESADDDNDNAAAGTGTGTGSHHLQQLQESIYSPVLSRACEVADELISRFGDENHRWELVASLWSEMLYYAAPRCGGAFHYKHLSIGGEFITHVLFLMYSLGPFLPTPAGA